jgi:hypothetical protein
LDVGVWSLKMLLCNFPADWLYKYSNVPAISLFLILYYYKKSPISLNVIFIEFKYNLYLISLLNLFVFKVPNRALNLYSLAQISLFNLCYHKRLAFISIFFKTVQTISSSLLIIFRKRYLINIKFKYYLLNL